MDSHEREIDRIREDRRRLLDAKIEARRLKRGDPPEDHPWILASRRAKEDPAGPEESDELSPHLFADGKTPWLVWASVLLVPLVAVASLLFLSPGSGDLGRGAPVADGSPVLPRLSVWHSASPLEEAALNRVSAHFTEGAARIDTVRFDDIEEAILAGIAAGNPPDLAVVEQATAIQLASWGALAPIDEDGALFLPLTPAAPWSRSLVAVSLRRQRTEGVDEIIRSFLESLTAEVHPAPM